MLHRKHNIWPLLLPLSLIYLMFSYHKLIMDVVAVNPYGVDYRTD